MKKILVLVMVVLGMSAAFSALAGTALPVYKAGETVYVCGCGAGCDCQTVSRKGGRCSCGNELAKSVVSKVEGDKAYVMVNGKEQVFTVKAHYSCACGEGCNCATISQKPGKCGCGTPMKQVR